MHEISVRRIQDSENAFEVHINDFTYRVTMMPEYYQELTGGKFTPEELVKKSFEFLLEREGPESILPEFDLKLINKYFPEYEEVIYQELK